MKKRLELHDEKKKEKAVKEPEWTMKEISDLYNAGTKKNKVNWNALSTKLMRPIASVKKMFDEVNKKNKPSKWNEKEDAELKKWTEKEINIYRNRMQLSEFLGKDQEEILHRFIQLKEMRAEEDRQEQRRNQEEEVERLRKKEVTLQKKKKEEEEKKQREEEEVEKEKGRAEEEKKQKKEEDLKKGACVSLVEYSSEEEEVRLVDYDGSSSE